MISTNLTRCLSDHCPILLESNPSNRVHLPKPFMFHSFWLSDLSFPCIVSEVWGQALPLHIAIDKFAKKATDWNRCHFGNIFGKKKRIMARLNGNQKVMADCPSHSLVVLEKELHRGIRVYFKPRRGAVGVEISHHSPCGRWPKHGFSSHDHHCEKTTKPDF